MPKKLQKSFTISFLQTTHKHWLLLAGVLLVLAVGHSACSKDKAALSKDWSARNGMPVLEMKLKGLDTKASDINGDGIDDQVLFYRDGQLVYAVRDIDFDGVIDLHEYYENNEHVRDEIDIDYDGLCDLIVIYKGGKVAKRYYSVDFQGTRQGVQIFDAAGHRIEVQRDTTDDGFLDTIEHFQAGEAQPYRIEKFREGEKNPYSVEEKNKNADPGEALPGVDVNKNEPAMADAPTPVETPQEGAQNPIKDPQTEDAKGME